MIIHTSHTKESLIKIIKLLNINIKYSNLIKDEIKENFYEYFLFHKTATFKRNSLNIKNVDELKKYLSTTSQKTRSYISVKDRQNLIEMGRTIVAFVNNGCDFDLSIFRDHQDLHHTVIFVCKYGGSISTCRRSIKLFNETLPPDKKYEMDLNYQTQVELQEKELKKSLQTPKFNFKVKEVLVDFS